MPGRAAVAPQGLAPDGARRPAAAGETYEYAVALRAGELVRGVFDPDGVEYALSVVAPNGSALFAVRDGGDGPIPVSLLGTAGVYTVRIRFAGGCRERGAYRLALDRPRPARQDDAVLVRADRAYAAGVDAERAQDAPSLESASASFETAYRLYVSIGDAATAVAASNRRGAARLLLGDTNGARAAFARADALAGKGGDAAGRAAALDGLAETARRVGDGSASTRFATEALALAASAGDARAEATARLDLGIARYALLRDPKKGAEDLEAARSAFAALDDPAGVARALYHLAVVRFIEFDYAAAEPLMRESIATSRACGDRRGALAATGDFAFFLGILGDNRQALALNAVASEESHALGDSNQEALALNGLGTTCLYLGDVDRALAAHERAVALFQKSGDESGVAATLLTIADLYLGNGRAAEALPLIARSRAISERLGSTVDVACADHSLARAALLGHDAAEAKRRCESALAVVREAGVTRLEARVLQTLGDALGALGKGEEATAAYARSLELCRETRDQVDEMSALYATARLARDAGRLDDARRVCEQALDTAESARASVAADLFRATYYASVHRVFELEIDVLMRMHERDPDGGFDALAFSVSERARARVLLESLGEGRVGAAKGADPADVARLRDLESRLRAKAAEQFHMLGGPHSPEDASRVEAELSGLALRTEEARADVRAASPVYAALTRPTTVDVTTVRRDLLDADTAMLVYALGDDRSFLWLVTPDGLSSFTLPNRREVEERATRYYAAVTSLAPGSAARASDAATAAAARDLGAALLGPVAGRLAAKRLVVVPDGALQHVPFAALAAPGDSGTLVDGHEVVMLPSASVLARLRADAEDRRPPAGRVAVIADPVFDSDDRRVRTSLARRGPVAPAVRGAVRSGVARLLASNDEARAIAEEAGPDSTFEAIGFDASRETVLRGDLAGYRVVHFATHSLLDTTQPELSSVVLSLVDRQGRPEDGFLRVIDLYGLDLPVDTVVLSACETALGKDVRGEGLVGLTRGFMYAGASRVVASLWRVDDEATAAFMRVFYRAMFRDGLRPAAALRRAQSETRAVERWRAPYYWAGFVIQGEYR